MRINHNMSAIIANNRLLRNENSLSEAVERLSSGLKINHASDDAAGMAIASKMRAQIKGLDQASQNSSDGISVLETADGAMNEVTNMLQRMRELSVQAANGIYVQEDLEAIQAEISSLTAEIDRVSSDTEFNTKKLLDGSLDRRVYLNSRDIERVEISDTVTPQDYKVTLDKDATHAVIVGAATVGTGVAGGIPEGEISINGSKVKITQGQDLQEVYENLRNAAEIGEVNLIATNDTTPHPDAANNKEASAYYNEVEFAVGTHLVFVSDRYGTNAEIKVNCDNPYLATYLGLATDVLTAKDTKAMPGNDQFGAKGASADGKNPVGKVTINGTEVDVTEGLSLSEIYDKLNAATTGDAKLIVTESLTTDPKDPAKEADAGYTVTTESPIDFDKGKYLVFIPTNGAELSISCDNPQLADYLGLVITYDSENNALKESGEDAKITLQKGADDSGFTTQATYTSDGRDVTITDRNGFKMSFRANPNAKPRDINFEVTDIGTMTLQIGANENQTMEVRIPSISTTALGIDDVDVCTVYGADRAINRYDKAIAKVSESRSRIGAYQNRLEYAVNSLDATEENMTSALSRIEDADMAQEMTAYTQYNVLTQAATSVLAQANDIPQQALQLLQ